MVTIGWAGNYQVFDFWHGLCEVIGVYCCFIAVDIGTLGKLAVLGGVLAVP